MLGLTNLVPRSLEDEAEGEIWPNPICITWSPVRNVTGEASAHAQLVAYNKLTTGLRHDLEILARISKFRCFQETKQTQNEVETFFLQLGRICFWILLRHSENFSDFCKVLSQFAFRNMIVPFYTWSSTRVQAPLHLPHKFFDVKSFYKILPLLPTVIPTCCFRAEIGRPRKRKKMRTGGGVCKVLCKKACVGDGGELERALDNAVWSCCKSCSIPNGKLLPNLSSSRLFLSASHFHQPRKSQG